MIKIVHYAVNSDDDGNIVSIELKFKHIETEKGPEEYPLLTTISMAFCETTLLKDVGKSFKLAANPRRKDIANMAINLKESKLSHLDIGKFISYFQGILDRS